MKGKEKVILVLWVIIIALMGLGGWTLREVLGLYSRNTALELELSTKTEQKDNIEILSREFVQYERLSSEVESLLPGTEEEVADFAGELESIAGESGLEIELQFDDFPGRVDVGGRYIKGLGVQLKLKGSYQSIVAVIDQLDHLDYFLRFDKVLMTRGRLDTRIDMVITGYLLMR